VERFAVPGRVQIEEIQQGASLVRVLPLIELNRLSHEFQQRDALIDVGAVRLLMDLDLLAGAGLLLPPDRSLPLEELGGDAAGEAVLVRAPIKIGDLCRQSKH
jgi:hypothetical protein